MQFAKLFCSQNLNFNCHLQGVLQQLLDIGVVSNLSEDLQWTIRMLLPRQVWCSRNPAEATTACHTSALSSVVRLAPGTVVRFCCWLHT